MAIIYTNAYIHVNVYIIFFNMLLTSKNETAHQLPSLASCMIYRMPEEDDHEPLAGEPYLLSQHRTTSKKRPPDRSLLL